MDHLKIIIRGEEKGKRFLSQRILVHLMNRRLQSGIFLIKPELLVREHRRKRACLREGRHGAGEELRVQWWLNVGCSECGLTECHLCSNHADDAEPSLSRLSLPKSPNWQIGNGSNISLV